MSQRGDSGLRSARNRLSHPQEWEDDDADDGEDGLERRGRSPRPGRVPLAGPECDSGSQQGTDTAGVKRRPVRCNARLTSRSSEG
jgi:hypothetical protein